MKSLISVVGNKFEPFNVITKGVDHYDCDGQVFPFTVVGDNCAIVDYVAQPPKPVVPQTVSMRQARLALYQVGKLAAVTAAINAAGEEAKLTWEYSSEVNRNDGLVPAMAASLGMTQAELDGLFILAATK